MGTNETTSVPGGVRRDNGINGAMSARVGLPCGDSWTSAPIEWSSRKEAARLVVSATNSRRFSTFNLISQTDNEYSLSRSSAPRKEVWNTVDNTVLKHGVGDVETLVDSTTKHVLEWGSRVVSDRPR